MSTPAHPRTQILLAWSSGKDSAMFRRAVELRAGDVVQRDGFVFADLLPATRS